MVWKRSGFLTPRFFCSAMLELDPVLEVLDGVGADAELDQMKRHHSSSPRPRLDGHQPGALGNLAAGRDRDAGDAAGARRGQRMLHLHRLDDRQTLALLHPLAIAHQQRQNLAVHRRLDLAIAAGVIEIAGAQIGAADHGLAALAQHVDGICGLDCGGIKGGRHAIHSNRRAARAIIRPAPRPARRRPGSAASSGAAPES